jgi:hypothetical protein
MRKRRDADANHVAAMPERIAVNEATSLFLCRHDVSAGDFVVMCKKLLERVIEPVSLGRPAGNWRIDALVQNISRDGGVVRQFHLIDRDGVGLELDRPAHRFAPLLFRLTHHPRNQIDVDLRKVDFARPLVSTIDLR